MIDQKIQEWKNLKELHKKKLTELMKQFPENTQPLNVFLDSLEQLCEIAIEDLEEIKSHYNKENFLKLVSGEADTLEKIRQRRNNRKSLNN